VIFEFVGWSETHDPTGLNRNLDASLGVPPYPLRFFPDHEIPEAGELHVLAALQCIADLGQYLLR
jgi:hypothetical protein